MAVPDLAIYRQPRETAPRRLSRLLGLPEESAGSEVALAVNFAGGLSPKAADRLASVLGRASVIGPVVPETTYRRAVRTGTPFSRDISDRLYNLSRVVDAAALAYRGDVPAMRDFLEGPHPLLEGRSALSVASASAAGADAVVALIDQAREGFPV